MDKQMEEYLNRQREIEICHDAMVRKMNNHEDYWDQNGRLMVWTGKTYIPEEQCFWNYM